LTFENEGTQSLELESTQEPETRETNGDMCESLPEPETASPHERSNFGQSVSIVSREANSSSSEQMSGEWPAIYCS
jgi:hypothetical protein